MCRLPLLKVLIKGSDISNPAKEWPLYKLWIGRLFREFHAQGDLEKQRGLAPANFMDRHVSCPPLAQQWFIRLFARPMMECVVAIAPSQAAAKPLLGKLEHSVQQLRAWQAQEYPRTPLLEE